jgi:membrane-associated protein
MLEAAHTLAAGGALDPQHLLQTVGLIGLLAIIFAECGLLVGFFLPGDTLLFAAGLLVKTGRLDQPLWLVIALTCIAAIAGNLCGYAIGHKAGPAVFNKPDSRLFRREYVERAERFFEKYGALSLVFARFVPVVRTFITVMAGAARMNFRRFTAYSVVGGVLWVTSVTLVGYWLGDVAFIANHLELIVLGGVLAAVLPISLEGLRRSRKSRRTPSA